MAELRELNYQETTRRLRKLGFRFYRHGKGSHELWVRDADGRVIPVPQSMTDLAIRVESPSKLYRIGPRECYKALRDTLTDAISEGSSSDRMKGEMNSSVSHLWMRSRT